jgi:AcrR family transcriptional regulator
VRRAYKSALRDEQSKQTRQRILEALLERLADEPLETLSIAKLAEHAGVSEPTVYRYFPNREALLAGFRDHVELHADLPATSAHDRLDDLAAATHGVFTYFAENERCIRAAQNASVMSLAREPGRRRRDEDAHRWFTADLDHLNPDEAHAVRAMLRVIIGSETWVALTGRHGVQKDAAANVAAWAVGALVQAIRAGRKSATRTLVTDQVKAKGAAMRRARREQSGQRSGQDGKKRSAR